MANLIEFFTCLKVKKLYLIKSKEETTLRVGCTHEMSTAHTPSVFGVES